MIIIIEIIIAERLNVVSRQTEALISKEWEVGTLSSSSFSFL
jgi:hypothetical protein